MSTTTNKKSSRQQKPNIKYANTSIDDEKESIEELEKFEVENILIKGQSHSKMQNF